MQKHQKVWPGALVFVASGTGETTKPWARSTDATDDTDWQEGNPTPVEMNGHVAWAGLQAAAGAGVPCNPVRPLCLCITPKPSSLQTLSPSTHVRSWAPGSMGVSFAVASAQLGQECSSLCPAGLGCFMPSLQPQGSPGQAGSGQRMLWWHGHQKQGHLSPSRDLQAAQVGQGNYGTRVPKTEQWR